MMQAAIARPRIYRAEARRTPARPVRRLRRRPLAVAVAFAILIVAPAVLLVSLRTHAASTGYEILALRQEIDTLQTDSGRLLATATTLRSLDRVERIATTQLGMAPPRQQQVAALTIPRPPAAARSVPQASLWQLVSGWLGAGEAEARTR